MTAISLPITIPAPLPVPATAWPKPIDVGTGTVAASFGRDGSWLSIGRPHAEHGFVELAGLPPFNERWRFDPDAVRRYRDWMAEERFAFLRLDLPAEEITARRIAIGDDGPTWYREGAGWRARSAACGGPDESEIVQRHVIEWTAATAGTAALRLSGRLARSVMPEITETNPMPQIRARTVPQVDGARLRLTADRLRTVAMVAVAGCSAHWCLNTDGADLLVPTVPGRTAVTVSLLLTTAQPGPAMTRTAMIGMA